MSYLVSARRWRPQTFEDLVGQEHVSRTLANAIKGGRVAHAFLFTGLRGVGKTTAARVLAKALNCEKGPSPVPCNHCTNCQEITAGSAVDVLEIDGASNTSVDDVRDIIENVRYQPAKCRFKVYIIDEVHMLSNSAFNALLKTLEEPPAHVKFIFATTDPHKLPPTVQSRCQRYDFRRIPLRLVVERLRQIVDAEKVEISDRALFILAREGEGSMRDAQSVLDQVLAGCGERISDDEVLQILGITDRALVYDIAAAIIDGQPVRALELVARVYDQGYDLRRLNRDLLEHFRNVAVARATGGSVLADLPDEEQALVREQAGKAGPDLCDRVFRILQEADEEVARAPYPRLILDLAMIKAATLPPLVPVDELLRRLDDLEARTRLSRATPSSSAPPSSSWASGASRSGSPSGVRAPAGQATAEPAGAKGAAANGGSLDWQEFVAAASNTKPTLAHYLARCSACTVNGDAIEIRAPRGFYYDYLARAEHVAEISELARQHLGRALRVTVVAEEKTAFAPVAAPPRPSTTELTETALSNPAVRAAIEILGGEIQEVRQRTPRRREKI